MKKYIVLLLSLIIAITAVFASCSTNKTEENDETTTADSLDSSSVDIGFETDEDGNEVAVVYEKDKKGNTIAVKLNDKGEKETKKNGQYVTVKTDYVIESTKRQSTDDSTTSKNLTTTKKSETTTSKIDKDIPMTSSADTTKAPSNSDVPKTSASGKKVTFSVEDQNTITSMLEVPFLYLDNYENSDGVPISIACHTAVWMAEHEGNIRSTYPSSPVVLNLFKFYGQTVVNFKTLCNDFAEEANAPIKYNKTNDTFTISEYTQKKQTVTITSIEDLGGNNYYKITGKVSGCNKKNVVAIIQKNKLDTSLGFSVMALKWS